MKRSLLVFIFLLAAPCITIFAKTNAPVNKVLPNKKKVNEAAALAFPSLAAKPYGTPDYDPGATSSSPVTYTSSNTAVVTIVAGKIHIVTTGTANITATDGTTTIGHTLTVTKATLTVTANNATKVYGSANPALTVTYSGFVNGDTQTALSTQATASTTATASSPTGNFNITPANAVSGRYAFIYVTGQLTITPAIITITANNTGKPTGAANPALSATYTGFVNGDTQTVITTPAALNTTATISSPAGNFPIIASGAAAANYTFNYVAGIFTIKSLSFPSPASKTYATTDYDPGATSGGPVTYTSSNTAVVSIVANNVHVVGVGTSNITATDGVSSITHTLVINKALVTVTPNAATQIYGSATPTLTASYSGLANGETNMVFTTQTAFTTNAVPASVTGSYTITAAGAAAKNYTFTYVTGKLTVTPATIMVTVNNLIKATGAANPALTAGYTGFVNSDTQSVITTLPLLNTTATSTSAAGSYPIIASGAAAANYIFAYLPGTLTVKGLVFPSIAAKIYGTADFDPGATGGAPITYTSSATAIATIVNGNIHTVTTGSANISATDGVTTISHTLTITKATLTVTPMPAGKIYGSVNPSFTSGYSGFVNTDGPTSLSTQPTITTTATSASATGTYPLTAAGAVSGKYIFVYAAGQLTVSPATITITVANAGKGVGAANPAFSATYTGFTNGDTQASLTTFPVFSTTATTSSAAGSYPITATGAAANNYIFTYLPGTLTVKSLTFPQPAAKAYGAADFDPGATSGGTVTYTSASPSVATIVNGKIHIVGVGTTNITATDGITSISHTQVVNKGSVTVTPNNATKMYGAANPALSFTCTGLASGETSTVFTAQPAVATTATAASATGTYPVTATGAAAKNYTFTYAQAQLTVTPATLTVTAVSTTKATGAVNPTLTATYTGFVNGDTPAVITTLPALNTTAISTSAAGNYPITVSGAAAANYIFTYTAGILTVKNLSFPTFAAKTYGTGDFDPGATGGAPITYTSANTAVATVQLNKIRILNTGTANISATDGVTTSTHTLTVIKAPLVITADNLSKTYGSANPALTVNYSGFVNGDTQAVLTTQPTSATSATAASPAGTYVITTSGAVSGKYSFVYNTGSLTVNPAIITATVNNAGKGTGAPNPAFTAAYSGFVNGETVSVISTPPTFTTNAVTSSATGTYAINASGAEAPNYTFNYIPGTLTVSPLVFSSPPAKIYGAADFSLSAASGGQITYTNSNPGVATITNGLVHILTTGQTSITATDGGTSITNILIINPAPLNIKANDATKVTGTANPAFSVTYTGFVNNEDATALTTLPNITTTATQSSPVGNYSITPAGAASGNYSFTYNTGVLTVISNVSPPAISYVTPQNYTTNVTISPLTPSNSGGPVTSNGYSINPSLPNGLTFDVSTGTISGTPTAVTSQTAFTITAVNEGGNGTATITLTISAPTTAPSINYIATQPFVVGTAITSLTPNSSAVNAPGYNNTPASLSSGFVKPSAIAIDNAGNLFIVDNVANNLTKIPADGSGALVLATGLNAPTGVALDLSGNIYVADNGNNQVKKFLPTGGNPAIIGSGFTQPYGVAVDNQGNIYVSDFGNNAVKKVMPGGVISSLYSVYQPSAIAVDSLGDIFFASQSTVTELSSSTNPEASGTIYSGLTNNVSGLAVDGNGNVYVTDAESKIIKLQLDDGGNPINIGTSSAGLGSALGIAVDASGNLYESDGLGKIFKFNPTGGYFITPNLPAGLQINSTTGTISGTPTTATAAKTYNVRAYNGYGSSTANVNITVLNHSDGPPDISYVPPAPYKTGVTITPLTPINAGGSVPALAYGTVNYVYGNGTAGSTDGPILVTGDQTVNFNGPAGLVVNNQGDIFVADAGNGSIRKISQSLGKVSTLVGGNSTGPAGANGNFTAIHTPVGIALNPAGDLFVADQANNVILKVTSAGAATYFAGNTVPGHYDGFGNGVRFNHPNGVSCDALGNLYIAEMVNFDVRKITPDGSVSTLAGSGVSSFNDGTGTSASFKEVASTTVDPNGNIYAADIGNNRLRVITPNGVVTTLAGDGTAGYADGIGTAARFNGIYSLASDRFGNVYASDVGNNAIRKITPAGIVSTFSGGPSVAASSTSAAGGLACDPRGIFLYCSVGNQVARINIVGYAISPSLPAGLQFDGTTGNITGSPNAAFPATNYTVTAYNVNGSSSATFKLSAGSGSANSMANNLAGYNQNTILHSDEPVVSSALSPNGDGKNDFFLIKNIEQYPDNKLTLIDRNSVKIFEAVGYDNSSNVFNGRFGSNGAMVKKGTYFYLLSYKDKGQIKHKTGYFLIK